MILFFGNFSGRNGGVQWLAPPVFLLLTILSSGLISGPLLWIVLAAGLAFTIWQVQRHGLWPTLRRLFVTGFQRGGQQQRQQQARPAGGQARRQSRKERFEEVAKAVQALPMEEYVTRADLERCSLHNLREKMRERGLRMEGAMERREAVELVLAADAGGATTSSSCSICCEDYASGEMLRRLACRHKFHLECIDRWFLSSTDYSRPVACPVCNTAIAV